MSKTNTVYRRIRDLRIDNDMTQAQVAKKIGLHLTTYQRYERAESPVPADLIKVLAKLYHVRADYILGLTNIPR